MLKLKSSNYWICAPAFLPGCTLHVGKLRVRTAILYWKLVILKALPCFLASKEVLLSFACVFTKLFACNALPTTV